MTTPAAGPPSETDLREFLSVGRGTFILILGTLVLFAASLASRVLIAQQFSLSDWGEFNIALALTGFLSLLSLVGLDQAAARSLSYESDPAVRRGIVRSTLLVSVSAATIASLLVYLLAAPLAVLFGTTALTGIFQVFSVTVGFGVLGLMLAALFQGFEDAAPNAVFNQMLNPALFVVAVALAVGLHWGFGAVVLGYAVTDGLALSALIGYALLRLPGRLPPVPNGAIAPGPSRRLWPLALSFWGVGSLSFITAFADTLILAVFRPPQVVGLYSAAMTLARVLLVANGALTYIYLPVAARLARRQDFPLIRATYTTGTRWSLLFVTPGLLAFALLPTESLHAIFGSSYGAGATTLQILAVAAFVSVLVGPANACQAGLGEVRTLLGATAAASVANVVLSFGLIPLYGAVGAALAWGVARTMYPGIGLVTLYRRYRINPFHRTLVRPLLFTLGVCVPLFLAVGALGPPAWVVFPLAGVACTIALLGLVATRSVVTGDFAIARGLEAFTGRPWPTLRRLLVARTSPVALGGPAP
ncbi:MAG: oligosaccharide flippase family protein [Thermoplasmata archaeon]|nr:oligosaccharide flippase family protein [Thermoplasmata archaeon]